MSTSFSTKCEILAEVHTEAKWNDQLKDFKEINDIGLPMAYLIDRDLVTPKDDADKYIEETWQELCKALEVDPEREYDNSDELLSASIESGLEEEEKEK